jgi:hypothetical protein
VEKPDTVKWRLTGIQGNESAPLVRIIGNDAIVGLFFDINHKPATPITEGIFIMGLLKDELETVKQRHGTIIALFHSFSVSHVSVLLSAVSTASSTG